LHGAGDDPVAGLHQQFRRCAVLALDRMIACGRVEACRFECGITLAVVLAHLRMRTVELLDQAALGPCRQRGDQVFRLLRNLGFALLECFPVLGAARRPCRAAACFSIPGSGS
jgi:hypothetical protein